VKKTLFLYVFLYLLLLAVPNNALSQTKFCGTQVDKDYKVKYFTDLKNERSFTEYRSLPNLNKTLSVSVHIIETFYSVSPLSKSEIEDKFYSLSQALEPIGLSFSVCSYDTILNPRFKVLDVFNNVLPHNREDDILYEMYRNPNTINIYYIDWFDDYMVSGAAYMPGGPDAIFLTRHSGINTLIHEMGHFFGLFHTFQNGDEYVSRDSTWANCETAGDGLCDTEADPLNSFIDETIYSSSVDCTVINSPKQDIFGDYYIHPTDNYMSYYKDECGQLFTPEQFSVMANAYLLYRNHLW